MAHNDCAGKALIFMTAHNCEMYAAAALESLARQTHDDLHVLYIDDCSDDATGDIAVLSLQSLFPGKHTYIRNETRLGKSHNAWKHLRPRAAEAEFIAVLDADDQLIDSNILAGMAKFYARGRDVVWTNYVTDRGTIGGNGPLDPKRSPRLQGWKTSHFFSFRASLIETVPEDYYKTSAGQWFPAACDQALAFPMLDQTRSYEFIPVNAYRYTAANPHSHHNEDSQSQGLNSAIQRECAQDVIRKPPLPLVKGAPMPNPTDAGTAHSIAAASPQSIWADKAADMLVVACPAILSAQAVVGDGGLTPLQAWSIYQFCMQKNSVSLLHIGGPQSALALAAITCTMSEVTMTCLTGNEDQKIALEALLAVCGLSHAAQIVGAEAVNASVGERSAAFPNVSALENLGRFSIAFIDSRAQEAEEDFVYVSLPALAAALDAESFKLAILPRDDASTEAAARDWAKLSTGLRFCPKGVGGTGLVVMGGR